MRGLIVSALALLAVIASSRASSAEEPEDPARAAARALGESGVEAYVAGDYVAASRRLEQSFQLLPVPSLGLWSARALRKLGRLLDAYERLQTVDRLPLGPGNQVVQQAAKAEAKREAEELASRIPTLRVELQGARMADAVIELDQRALTREDLSRAIAVDPGRHEIEAEVAGHTSRVALILQEGQHETAVLRFTSDAAAQPPVSAMPAGASRGPDRTPAPAIEEAPSSGGRVRGLIAMGVAGAGVVVGGAAGVLAFSTAPNCPNDLCPPGSQGAVDESLRYGHIANVSFAVAGVAAGYGLWELLTAAGWSDAAAAPKTPALMVSPSRSTGLVLEMTGVF